MSLTWSTPDLSRMPAHGIEVWGEAFQLGYGYGVEEGRRQVLVETWGEVEETRAGRELKRMALRPAYADVLDARGQHDAAARYRELLRDRGIAS